LSEHESRPCEHLLTPLTPSWIENVGEETGSAPLKGNRTKVFSAIGSKIADGHDKGLGSRTDPPYGCSWTSGIAPSGKEGDAAAPQQGLNAEQKYPQDLIEGGKRYQMRKEPIPAVAVVPLLSKYQIIEESPCPVKERLKRHASQPVGGMQSRPSDVNHCLWCLSREIATTWLPGEKNVRSIDRLGKAPFYKKAPF